MGFAAWRIKSDEEICGASQPVGEVQWMGVVPDRQRQGIGSQLLANALQIMFHEHGSDDLMIRIDVDTDNGDARHAYEGWGFEHYRSFVSEGNSYETLLLRPPAREPHPR